MNCPYNFNHQGKQFCVLGIDCASKTPDQKITCRNVSSHFHQGLTPREIETMKKKIIHDLRKENKSSGIYQLPEDTSPEKSVELQRKELQDKIRNYHIKS